MSSLIALLLLSISPSNADDKPLVQRDAPYEVLPARLWDFTHLHLDVTIDPEARTVAGVAVHTVGQWQRLQ